MDTSHKRVWIRLFATICIVGMLGVFATVLVPSLGKGLANLLAAAMPMKGASTTTYFTPDSGETLLAVGSTTDIDLNINTSVPVNALGATITFPRDLVEIVGISKARSFMTLWTEDTVIKEESGELHFSGGTTARSGALGTSTVLTITVRAKASGEAQLTVKDLQILAADGRGSELTTSTRALALAIAPPHTAVSGAGSGSAPSPRAPSPDFNGDGNVTLTDLSILVVKILAPYETRYDLNMDGKVSIADLSILLAQMSR